jgi:glycosyltransferase involved in cell wall biosynthesis
MKKPEVAMLLDNPFRPDLRVLREARALIDLGYSVTIYAWDRDKGKEYPTREIVEGIKVIRVRVKTDQQMGVRQVPCYLRYFWYVFWLLMRDRFDIVHCHDLLNLPIGTLMKLLRGVHLVYDAHEIYWIMEAKKYPAIVLNFLRHIETILLRFVDAFITVGDERSAYYNRYYRREIYVVGNWYDPKEPERGMKGDFRDYLRIPEEAFTISFAGTLAPERATEILVETANELRNNSKIHWLIGGRGPLEQIVREAASQNSKIHFLGWVEDMDALLSASDALVYLMDPSHPYTAYNAPNTLYLSIAWNIPLIGVDAGEVGAALTPNKTGLLIKDMSVEALSSAVFELYDSPKLYKNIVEGLIDLQATYNWQSAIEALADAYNSLKSSACCS